MLELTGLERVAEQRTQKLSGGQTQRVRLAVALVSDPELLDARRAHRRDGRRGRGARSGTTMRAFAARGKTMLFATHYLEEADAYADRAVLMAAGRIVADGADRPRSRRASARARSARRSRAPTLDALEALPGVERGRAPRRGGDAALRRLRRGDPGAARGYPRGARHRDRGGGPRGGLPRAHRRRRSASAEAPHDALDLHALRAAAHASQPPLLPASRSASRWCSTS